MLFRSFTDSGVSSAIDRTRERIYSLSANDVTEDEVVTTDAVLAGLAYQYAAEQSCQVAILVSDRLAEQAIGDALSSMDLKEKIDVVEGKTFLDELREDVHEL